MKHGTRQRILDAATDLFGLRGVDAVSLDVIATEVGVAKQTLLYWFPSKDDLVQSVLAGAVAELAVLIEAAVRAAPDEPLDRIAAVVRAVFRPAVRRPALLGLVREVDRLAPASADRLRAELAPLVERGVAYLHSEMDAGRLGEIQAEMQVELAERGVEFGPPHSRAPFGVDAFPRIFAAGLWADLEKGLAQRVKALNAFLDDVYTNRRVVEAGVLPARILDEAMHYEPLMEKVDLPVVAQVAGPDLVRGADGEFSVLEDNLRTPSGLAYASVGRPVLEKAYAGAGLDPRPYESTFDLLGRAIRAADPSGQGDPSAALLIGPSVSRAADGSPLPDGSAERIARPSRSKVLS